MHLDKEILTLSCRLKDLSLHFSPRSLSCLLTFTQSPLEHLELRNINQRYTSENPPPIVLHSAPSLKSLSLSWCSLDLGSFQVPWAQLQHLKLDYDASSFWNPVHGDYLRTLSHCPNLTTLRLGIGAPINEVDPAHIESVTLPHVHTFQSSIHVQTPYLQYFFDALRMPQLHHFAMINGGRALGRYAECLPFLVRSSDTLESVCFTRVDGGSAMVSCLAQLHRLKMMWFLPAISRLNRRLITALTLDESGGEDERICPALEMLYLRCYSDVPTVDAITYLVASRCRTAPKLKRLSLEFVAVEYELDYLDTTDEKIEELQVRLRSYVQDGLQLVATNLWSRTG